MSLAWVRGGRALCDITTASFAWANCGSNKGSNGWTFLLSGRFSGRLEAHYCFVSYLILYSVFYMFNSYFYVTYIFIHIVHTVCPHTAPHVIVFFDKAHHLRLQ